MVVDLDLYYMIFGCVEWFVCSGQWWTAVCDVDDEWSAILFSLMRVLITLKYCLLTFEEN